MNRDIIDGVTVITIPRNEKVSNTGYTGIHYMAKNNTHQVRVKSQIIGWRVNISDALALRAEALQHIADGTFDTWYGTLKSKRRRYNKK